MQMWVIGKPKISDKTTPQMGFTLIEVLVVMFIIGVILLSLTSRLGYQKSQHPLEDSLLQFNSQVKFALDYATFQQTVLSVTFHQNGYYFSDYHPSNSTQSIALEEATTTWQLLTSMKNLTPQHWAYPKAVEEVVVSIEDTVIVIDDLESDEGLDLEEVQKTPPHIIIFPNYETNDFKLILLGKDAAEVSIDANSIGFNL